MNPASVAMGPWLPGQYVARGSLDTTVYSQLSSQAVHSLTESGTILIILYDKKST